MNKNNLFLIIVEFFVMGGILFALISPLFSSEEQESTHLKNKIYVQLVKK